MGPITTSCRIRSVVVASVVRRSVSRVVCSAISRTRLIDVEPAAMVSIESVAGSRSGSTRTLAAANSSPSASRAGERSRTGIRPLAHTGTPNVTVNADSGTHRR